MYRLIENWLERFGAPRIVGPFTAPGAAGVTAASQTNLDCRYSHPVSAAALGFVATRAGSIVGLSSALSAAAAGGSVVVAVTVNGTEIALTTTHAAAGDTEESATAERGTYAFVAGDVIGVSYTSGAGLSNTPALVASVEIR